jgi:hypothetical protein
MGLIANQNVQRCMAFESSGFRMLRLVDKLILIQLAASWFAAVISTFTTPWYISLVLGVLALLQTAVVSAYTVELNKDEQAPIT